MISIVTPCLNQGNFLKQCIDSLLTDRTTEYEHIIIDGGSTDKTLDVINNFNDLITWISEKDCGQADAVNKGFRIAQGDIFGWLNADDYYHPETLRFVNEYFENHPEVVFLYGDGMVVTADGTIIGLYPTEEFLLERLAYRGIICQPTAFWRRSLWEEIGPLDISLQYAMDHDFWIRTGKALIRHPEWQVTYIHQVFSYSRMHRHTKTMVGHREVLYEIIGVVKRNFGFIPFNWIYGIEEIRDSRYDGIVKKSPLNIALITKSMVKWIWVNQTRPDHIVRFIGKVLFSPRKSWQTMVERVGGTG